MLPPPDLSGAIKEEKKSGKDAALRQVGRWRKDGDECQEPDIVIFNQVPGGIFAFAIERQVGDLEVLVAAVVFYFFFDQGEGIDGVIVLLFFARISEDAERLYFRTSQTHHIVDEQACCGNK